MLSATASGKLDPRRRHRRDIELSNRERSLNWPGDSSRGMFPQLPKDYLVRVDARHDAPSLGLSVEFRVAQKAANKVCRVSAPHIQPDQTIMRMRPIWTIEITIQAEESRVRQSVEQGDQVLIFGSRRSNVATDDTKTKSPLTQPEPLSFGKVFVEHQH